MIEFSLFIMGACHIQILKIGEFCFTESEEDLWYHPRKKKRKNNGISVRGALSLLWEVLVPLHPEVQGTTFCVCVQR